MIPIICSRRLKGGVTKGGTGFGYEETDEATRMQTVV